METIKLDLIPGKKMPSLHASQYDDGREHGIDLFENGVVYKLDGTETLTINERKGDDCICSLDIENTFTGSNHIVFASTEQMCAVWGNNICELVIAKGEKTIGTLNFILEIEPSPTEGGIESESEISNLERQITEITEQVIGDDYYTAEETDEAIATAIEGKADTTYVNTELAKKADKTDTYTKTETNSLVSPKADKTYVDSVADTKADKATTYTKTEVDTLIDNLPEPMIFKGTLGVGGTIQTLPTASASNEGYTYKVITDGTYAGQTAKVGDVFTSNGSAWVYIPSGDEDNDTWRNIKVNGVEKLGNGISSGAVDFVGSENIEVEFDGNGNKVGVKTKNIYTESEVDDIVYNILPDDTTSGSVANFNTSLELPIKSLKIDVNAVQASGTPTLASPLPISGWSEISLVHCGVNLWDEDWELGIWNSSGEKSDSQKAIRCKNYIKIKPSETYYVFANFTRYATGIILRLLDANKSFVRTVVVNSSSTKTFTADSNVEYVVWCSSSTDQITTYSNDVSINYPSSDTEYHAYNPNSQDVTIALGDTYYGGHFTQDKAGHRQLVVTHELKHLKDLNVRYSNNSGAWASWLFYVGVDDKKQGRPIKCTHYETVTILNVGNLDNLKITAPTWSNYIYWRDDTYTSADDFIQNAPDITILIELATPIIIDLPDGEPIITLNGTNNIYADTGDTEVVFKSSVNDYVSAHSGGNLLGMGGVYLGGAKSGGGEEETDEGEDTEKVKLDETKEEIKTIGDTKKLGGE